MCQIVGIIILKRSSTNLLRPADQWKGGFVVKTLLVIELAGSFIHTKKYSHWYTACYKLVQAEM